MPRSRYACLLALAALPLVAACGGADDDAAPARPASSSYETTKAAPAPAPTEAAAGELVVDMAASQFAPAQVTVAVGQTIRWTNSDAIAHTVTATDGAGFDSGTVEGGGEFSYTTRKAGRISYLCEFHPGMTGTITVQ